MSVQCIGITRENTQCRNKVSPPERCCYRHKNQCAVQGPNPVTPTFGNGYQQQTPQYQQPQQPYQYQQPVFNITTPVRQVQYQQPVFNITTPVRQVQYQQPVFNITTPVRQVQYQQQTPQYQQPQPYQPQIMTPSQAINTPLLLPSQWNQQVFGQQQQPIQPRPSVPFNPQPPQPYNGNPMGLGYGRPLMPQHGNNPVLAPLGIPGTPVEAVAYQQVQQRTIPPLGTPFARNVIRGPSPFPSEMLGAQRSPPQPNRDDLFGRVNQQFQNFNLRDQPQDIFEDDPELVQLPAARPVSPFAPVFAQQPAFPEVVLNRPRSVSPALAMLQELPQHIVVPKEHHVDPDLAPPVLENPLENPGDLHDCYICYDDDNRVSNRNLLACGHAICVPCLSALRQTVCPFCRQPLEGPLLTRDLRHDIERRQTDDEQQQQTATMLIAMAIEEDPNANPDELYNRYVVGLQ